MIPRVTIVTAGHLSTCPRMLKAADALHAAGYRVRVVSVNHTAWATAGDRAVMAARHWEWIAVDYAYATARLTQLATGARLRAAQAVAVMAGPSHTPVAAAIRAISRAHDEIVRAATAVPADFVYGGTTGALAAVAESAERLGVPYALDLEDFHSGEIGGDEGARIGALVERVERGILGGARFLTAASPLISGAYGARYAVRPITIHNTFSIAPAATAPVGDGLLRIYWFSQTLGPGRQLEDLIRAVGRSGIAAILHMRAHAIPDYLDSLRVLQRAEAPALELAVLDPSAPDAMVPLAQPYRRRVLGRGRRRDEPPPVPEQQDLHVSRGRHSGDAESHARASRVRRSDRRCGAVISSAATSTHWPVTCAGSAAMPACGAAPATRHERWPASAGIGSTPTIAARSSPRSVRRYDARAGRRVCREPRRHRRDDAGDPGRVFRSGDAAHRRAAAARGAVGFDEPHRPARRR